jgi:hypothetical protein
MDVDCDGIDSSCKVSDKTFVSCGLGARTDFSLREIKMAKLVPILALWQRMKYLGL